jgi:acyl-CoA synthetase (AMP-forming)/AMP-acid ligase II/acyl carrier protein
MEKIMGIIDCLREHAIVCPEKEIFIFLNNDQLSEQTISYHELMIRVSIMGESLSEFRGSKALLIYQDTLEFIVSFLGCLYAGIIAVPVLFNKSSRQRTRLTGIIENASVNLLLTSEDHVAPLHEMIGDYVQASGITVICTDTIFSPEVPVFNPSSQEIAFIQYTSGSTDIPKGVVISNQNLTHNQEMIRNTFHCDQDAVICSWLPFHHDMGLIGNILHTIHVGCTCVLFPPYHFMQQPLRWLTAITKYKVTHSGAPNFAYDLCIERITPEESAQLDLSSWQVAYNGAEIVRGSTIIRFSDYFKSAGFSKHAFYPCYGLAEATLMVSGVKEKGASPLTLIINRNIAADGKVIAAQESTDTKLVTSSGRLSPGIDLVIIRQQDQEPCNEMEEGEICIAGKSVTSGYWNKDNRGTFIERDGRRWLRTGDTGFLYQRELFVLGRMKEMLIIRGVNYYPWDIELVVSNCSHEIVPNGVAVFSTEHDEEEVFVIIAEIKRTAIKTLNAASLINTIQNAVAAGISIFPHDVILTLPHNIPRTSSGKLQRIKCGQLYNDNALNVVSSARQIREKLIPPADNRLLSEAVLKNKDYDTIRHYLMDLIRLKTGSTAIHTLHDDILLTEIGMDSLKSMELINTINKDLHINIDVTNVFYDRSIRGLINIIESLLWIKNEQNFEKGIII